MSRTTHSHLFLLLAALSALAWPAVARGQEPGPGSICIAPFKTPSLASEPPMSTTPAPSASSKFTFRIGKELKATVGNGEMALITGVPVDRKVLVEIRMDGRPFESFRLDLGKEPGKRVCLWLYPGYWHWIDNGWNAKLGCKCKTGT